jgi:hypothetical protein
MRNELVAKAFAERRVAKGEHLYTTGEVIFSYGEHFPIAAWAGEKVVLWNVECRSMTTRRHKSVVLKALPENIMLVQRTTQQLRDFLFVGQRQVVPVLPRPTSVAHALQLLEERLRMDANPRRVPFLMRRLRAEVDRFLVGEVL